MKLIRLIGYFLLGYLAYKLFGAMSAEGISRRRQPRRALRRALNTDSGRYGVLTGPGVGRDEYVEEPSTGAVLRERVGRGVVSR